MPSINVVSAGAACTADSTSLGVITVADTTPFFAGAEAWLSNATLNQHVRITKILTATTLEATGIPDSGSNVSTLNYQAGGDFSAFTTATTSRLDMPNQTVRVEPQYIKRNTAY